MRRTQSVGRRANSRCSNRARQFVRMFASGAARQASDPKRETFIDFYERERSPGITDRGIGDGVSSPYDEPLLFRQKWPKPLTPRLASWKGRDANPKKSGPTRQAQTGSAGCEERPSLGPAGRRQTTEYEPFRDFHKRERTAGMGEVLSGWGSVERFFRPELRELRGMLFGDGMNRGWQFV